MMTYGVFFWVYLKLVPRTKKTYPRTKKKENVPTLHTMGRYSFVCYCIVYFLPTHAYPLPRPISREDQLNHSQWYAYFHKKTLLVPTVQLWYNIGT